MFRQLDWRATRRVPWYQRTNAVMARVPGLERAESSFIQARSIYTLPLAAGFDPGLNAVVGRQPVRVSQPRGQIIR